MDLVRTTDIAKRLCHSADWGTPVYIDQGNSAAVFQIQHPKHGHAALKIYDPVFFEGENALIEAQRVQLQAGLKNHGCPHLIEVIDVGELTEDGTWYLLMGYCPWPSLDKQLAQIPNSHVHGLLKQLVEAVLFLDGLGYVHRDIKPANIAVSDDYQSLKLLDLGVLRKISPDEGCGTDGRRFIATAQYSPPEFLTREEQPGARGFEAINVYQVGAVLHDLIMKVPLFGEDAATKNKFILFKAVTEKTPRLSNSDVPARLLSLCARALDKDPMRRLQSVALKDFVANADDAETLRRRVAGTNSREHATPAPSLDVNGKKVRTWIGAAARLERTTLGPAIIVDEQIENGLRWSIRFTNAVRPVFVEVCRTNARLSVQVVSDTSPPEKYVVFEIGAEGPDLTPSSIPGAMAEQYLVALDLALTDRSAEALEEKNE